MCIRGEIAGSVPGDSFEGRANSVRWNKPFKKIRACVYEIAESVLGDSFKGCADSECALTP